MVFVASVNKDVRKFQEESWTFLLKVISLYFLLFYLSEIFIFYLLLLDTFSLSEKTARPFI